MTSGISPLSSRRFCLSCSLSLLVTSCFSCSSCLNICPMYILFHLYLGLEWRKFDSGSNWRKHLTPAGWNDNSESSRTLDFFIIVGRLWMPNVRYTWKWRKQNRKEHNCELFEWTSKDVTTYAIRKHLESKEELSSRLIATRRWYAVCHKKGEKRQFPRITHKNVLQSWQIFRGLFNQTF